MSATKTRGKLAKHCPRCGELSGGWCACWQSSLRWGLRERPHFAVYKLTADGWTLWWVGRNRESASAEFRLCQQYGDGAKLRAFVSFDQYLHSGGVDGGRP